MKDHLLTVKDLLKKYSISKPITNPQIVTGSGTKNNGRQEKTNEVFPPRDRSIWYLIYESILDPSKILSLISVTFLMIIYLINKEEKKHLLLFIFTITIIIISTTVEIYGEIKINVFYKKKAISHNNKILVDNVILEIEHEYVHVGDIIIINGGDITPADCILIESNDLSISRNELTGSNEIHTKSLNIKSDKFEDSKNVILSGDKIITGNAKALAVKVGKESKISEIYEKTIKRKDLESLLYTELNIFFYGVFLASVSISIILSLLGLITGISFKLAVDLTFSICLAFIPECIPTTIKFMLFSSVSKLEAKGIVIRDVGVMEKLGLITTVCVEKDAFIPPENIFCSKVYNGEKIIDIQSAFEDKNFKEQQFLESIGQITVEISRNKLDSQRRKYHLPLKLAGEIFMKYFASQIRISNKVKDINIYGMDGIIMNETNFLSIYITGEVVSVLKMCTEIKINGEVIKLTEEKKDEILNLNSKMHPFFNEIVAVAYEPYGKHNKSFNVKSMILLCIYFLEEMPLFNTSRVTNVLKSADVGFSIVTNLTDESSLKMCKTFLDAESLHCLVHSDKFPTETNISSVNFNSSDINLRSNLINNNILSDSNLSDINLRSDLINNNILSDSNLSNINLRSNLINNNILSDSNLSDINFRSDLINNNILSDSNLSDINLRSNLINNILSHTEFNSSNINFRSDLINHGNFLIYCIDDKGKNQLIKDMKNLNHIVCFIGTGINDCQPVYEADIGVCFEDSGIISKEAASIVFESGRVDNILYCMEEGRLFFVNLQKAVKYITSHIIPQVIPFVFYACFGTPIAISSMLLIFLNYLVEMIPAILLTNEEPEFNLLSERQAYKKDLFTVPQVSLSLEDDTFTGNIKKWYRNYLRICDRGLIYHLDTLTWSILETGLISSAGCMMAFYLTLHKNKVPLSKMFFSANKYFIDSAPVMILNNGKIINYEKQLQILYEGETTYFLSMTICQFANMLVCRREKNYFFHHFFKNFRIIFFSLIGVGISVLIVYLPFFQEFLLLNDPYLTPLYFPFGSAALILLIDTYRKYRNKHLLG